MADGRKSESKETLHLRIDRGVLRGVDALAMVWGVTRNEAANRLLDEGVAAHIDEVVDAMMRMVQQYKEGRFDPPDVLADDVVRQDQKAG